MVTKLDPLTRTQEVPGISFVFGLVIGISRFRWWGFVFLGVLGVSWVKVGAIQATRRRNLNPSP